MRIFGRRRRQSVDAPRDAVVEIDVGFDRFHAQLLVEACRAEGCTVELLTMDDSGQAPGLPALVPHKLLVFQQDLEVVRAVLRRSEWTGQATSEG